MAIAAFIFSITSVVLAWFQFWYPYVGGAVALALLLVANIVGVVLFQIRCCCQKGPPLYLGRLRCPFDYSHDSRGQRYL